ncbi:MAG: hypothetical protein JXO22_06400 [Phycisphaerae bacterium]|nr:hypothetical protein [Phycisphaerae bacterium]
MATRNATRLRGRHTRRGASIILVASSMTVLIGFTALAVDVGYLYCARAEMQSAADAAALAGVGALLTEERLKSDYQLNAVLSASRGVAQQYIAANPVLGTPLQIDANGGNDPGGDLVFGYLADATDRDTPLDLSQPSLFNSVQVKLHCNDGTNGPIGLGFARIFGVSSTDLSVSALATAEDGIVGYSSEGSTNPQILPLALQVNVWMNLLATGPTCNNDDYSYDPDSDTVSSGGDSLPELNLYPGAGSGQLPPGNFGTVDIGSSNNSTRDLARQILYGISDEDLAYFGGELRFGPDGTLLLNGDTGLSAGIKDELTEIIGEPRSIPLFTTVSGPGNNAEFVIVGFAGVRILDVRLTGPMNKKHVIIQPAIVVDGSAIAGGGNSYYVYRPVALSR